MTKKIMKTAHANVTNRRNVLTEEQWQEIARLNREGKLSWNQLAHQYAVSRMTIYRIVKSQRTTPEQEGHIDTGNQQQAVGKDMCRRIYSAYG